MQRKSGPTTSNGVNPGPSTSSGTSSSEDLLTNTQLLQKALKRHQNWPDKDQLLDVVYWGRQILGAILGVLWGCVPLYGILGLALFLATSTLIVHYYVSQYQEADVDNLGGFLEVAKEGFMSSFASFLICWIVTYSALHAPEQEIFD